MTRRSMICVVVAIAAIGCAEAACGADENNLRLGDRPIGWASVDGGTTGGASGAVVRVSDESALVKHLRGDQPATVVITGSIRLSSPVRVGSNKTVVGTGKDAVLTGAGLQLKRSQNVIVRNLAIRDAAPDAISIEGQSHHVWVDHCDLSACRDGLLDIKHASDLVTVSWCHFHNHHKTCLLGHSDKASVLATDRGKLRVTYHHNFFDGTQTRHPRVRAAETVHVLNNYYRGNEYGVASTDDAGVLVEGNFFERVQLPTLTRYGESKESGRLVERDNRFVNCGAPQSDGRVLGVPYRYARVEADQVPTMVRQGAGVRQVDWNEVPK